MSKSGNRLFLLTNDDGPFSMGMRKLGEALANFGRVITVVPHHVMSGSSHGLTLNRPLQLKETEPDFFIVDGTPADCVKLALCSIMEEPPDLLISGGSSLIPICFSSSTYLTTLSVLFFSSVSIAAMNSVG